MRINHIVVLMAMSLTALCAAGYTLRGSVSDGQTHEKIPFATVKVTPGNHVTQTDASGNFYLTIDGGNYTVTVSFVGYKSSQSSVVLNSDRTLDLNIEEDSHVLGDVVVTAKESTGITSTSRIDRDAMAHLQPTSFTDLMELLPGNISHNPNMGAVNSIKLRETGSTNSDYDISSLGTLFMVDGAPINGDANMQNVPDGSEAARDMTGKGVDMRTLSTDNIESVEVIRGIPSAEYGNLTSGMVNIKRIRRATPLTARFKADEYSKLVSLGKGFNLGNSGHIMNVDGGYLDSKVDPRNNLENYKRLNLSARLNLRWERPAFNTGWITGLDYTGSFDKIPT